MVDQPGHLRRRRAARHRQPGCHSDLADPRRDRRGDQPPTRDVQRGVVATVQRPAPLVPLGRTILPDRPTVRIGKRPHEHAGRSVATLLPQRRDLLLRFMDRHRDTRPRGGIVDPHRVATRRGAGDHVCRPGRLGHRESARHRRRGGRRRGVSARPRRPEQRWDPGRRSQRSCRWRAHSLRSPRCWRSVWSPMPRALD